MLGFENIRVLSVQMCMKDYMPLLTEIVSHEFIFFKVKVKILNTNFVYVLFFCLIHS